MNETLKQWFDSCTLAPGLLGCVVRRTDGSFVSQSFHVSCPVDQLEESLRSFGDSLPSFNIQGFKPRWLTWNFEKGLIRLAERADGLLLGLVIEPNAAAAQNLDLLTEEFFALDLFD